MDFNELVNSLPEVVVDEERTKDGYTYVHVGEWHFCVEDDLEERDGLWWNDAKTWIAYARYLDQVKAERGV
jgi:hypothetical protein